MSDLSVETILEWINIYGQICPSCRNGAWVSCVRGQKVQARACLKRHEAARSTPFKFTVEQLEGAATGAELVELTESRKRLPLSVHKLEQLKRIYGSIRRTASTSSG